MRDSGPVRILLVEDDEVDRMAVQRLFAKECLPYDLVVAGTVAEATARMREGGIDLVLIDQKLPDGCGLEVQREVGGTPHIFITGADDLSVAVEAMKAGAADFLVKDNARQYLHLLPLTIESTLKQEEHVQARRRAEDALQKAHDELEVQVRERTAQLVSTIDRLVKEVEARKRVEKDLQESEQRYRSLIDDVLDTSATGIFILDAQFKIVWISQAIERYFGLRREEVVGKDKRQVIGERIKDIFEDPESFVEKVLATYGNNVYVERFECHVLPDGQREGRWLEHSSLPICLGLYAGGRIETYYDITERKQAETALQESEQRFRALVETTSDWIWEVDRSGVYTYASPKVKELLGYEPNEVVGRTPFDLMPPDEAGRVAAAFNSSVESCQPIRRLENTNVHKDGRPVILETNATPILDSSGNVRGYRGIDRDITERKRAEEERENLITALEAQNAELERFAYTVSHDLKSPLITLKAYMGVLKEDLAAGDAGAVEDDLTRMASAADKMAQLLNELLELSRIGRVVNPPQHVALGEIAREATELVEGRINQGGVQVEIAPDTPVIFGDHSRLVEVLQNLIENAVKWTEDQPDPRIIIGARQDNHETVCYVRDNGTGIDPRYHERIFRLFEKLDSNSEGSGVGLALVKQIIEVHCGRVWVESEGVGHGSTFCFTLPQRTDLTECGEGKKRGHH